MSQKQKFLTTEHRPPTKKDAEVHKVGRKSEEAHDSDSDIQEEYIDVHM
jgi:hypothetical protein